ncbi:hypothetical protein Y710_11030 [Gordonia sp. QH-12]|uniref:hypothetical protein n=1 Tax=Gordonia TaxID=2053 RepID=UPI0007840F56|nr:hypothetical protein [Gordonia sp. QH-12]KXT57009.1 hypothetical protein Y710_11030 [Gordonia sp. QH-12]
MTLTVSELVGAAGGGALGAALGAIGAFSLMGVIVVVATLMTAISPDAELVQNLAFGPVFGPHVMFAGGAAAAAYAAHIRRHESGRDIAKPLITYDAMSIIGVGAGFGVVGQLLARAVEQLPTWHASDGSEVALVDSLAVSVVLTALIAAVLWARTPAPVRLEWLPWQHRLSSVLVVGAAGGAIAGSVFLAWPQDSRPMVGLFLYGASAVTLLALVFGAAVPVTHHLTLPAALAAGVAAAHTGESTWILVSAVLTGIVSSLVAEGWARLILERCRIHLDPPAFAIAVMATLLALIKIGVA